jgi:hypothetical protein
VLTGTTSNGGSFDDEDLGVALLDNANTLRWLDQADGGSLCDAWEVQVVELTGLTVDRGGEDAGLAVGQTSMTLSGLPAMSANRAVLSHARIPFDSPPDPKLCGVLVRSEASTASSLTFTRGAGVTDGGCALEPISAVPYQRLDFGARATVQTLVRTLNALTTDITIGLVEPERTLVFASGQIFSGQGSGETSFGGTNIQMGVGNARLELTSPTNVRATRGRNTNTATVTLYVVEFDP